MKIHEVKINSQYVDALLDGSKNFEVRWNDRDYQVGDVLNMREVYTAFPGVAIVLDGERAVRREISYVFEGRDSGLGLLDGWVVLGLQEATDG